MTPDEVVQTFDGFAGRLALRWSRRCRYSVPADDLKQEALIGALNANARFVQSGDSDLVMWIRCKMYLAVIDAIKQDTRYNRGTGTSMRSREQSVECTPHSLLSSNPWREVERTILIGQLVDSVECRNRDIINRQLMGESKVEIAKSLGVSAGRIHQRHQLAVMGIRERISKTKTTREMKIAC